MIIIFLATTLFVGFYDNYIFSYNFVVGFYDNYIFSNNFVCGVL